MSVQPPTSKLYTYVRWCLVAGLLVSFVFLVVGTVALVVHPESEPHQPVAWKDLLKGVAALNPSAFLTLGILLLFATPLVRVLTAFSFFTMVKDWRFALVSAMVLAILLGSILAS